MAVAVLSVVYGNITYPIHLHFLYFYNSLHNQTYSILSSVQSLSRVQVFATPWTAECQASLSITNSRSYPNPCPLSQWCYPTISSSAATFSFCLQSFLSSRSFPLSQFFTLGGQNIGTSALASVLSMNIQGWFLLKLTGLLSMQSKGLSRVFFSTTVRKHQFFGAQPSLWSNSHIRTFQILVLFFTVLWDVN